MGWGVGEMEEGKEKKWNDTREMGSQVEMVPPMG